MHIINLFGQKFREIDELLLFFSLAEKDRRLKAEMEARRKEEEKHNEQLEADRRAARTLQEKLNEENRMLREQIGKNLMYKN